MDILRKRLAATAAGPFRHVDYPLATSFDHMGDPGLHGPDSISWRVLGDVASLVGGIRGLLIQAAHPEVVAGVGDHSRYREDPLGRLSRTSAYVTATTYGAMPEVAAAVETVKRIHRRVNGVSERGVAYDAADPHFSAWVHNALTDSFLVANQIFGSESLSRDDCDRFVVEQQRVGDLLGADPMPDTARNLHVWIAEHPDIAPSDAMTDAVEFLENPPLTAGVLTSYKVLRNAAIATIPIRVRRVLGLESKRGAIELGQLAVKGLQWAMGSSPSWAVALVRTGSDVPPELFRQPLPIPPPLSQ